MFPFFIKNTSENIHRRHFNNYRGVYSFNEVYCFPSDHQNFFELLNPEF